MADMDISDEGNNFLMYKVKTWFFIFWRHLFLSVGISFEIQMNCISILCIYSFSLSFSEDFVPPESTVLEEDEAEQELQKQLEKQRKLRQKRMLKDSGERVSTFQSWSNSLAMQDKNPNFY